MAPPPLRIPIGLDMAGFRQSIDQAKSLTSTATDFMLKEFAKNQLTLAVNSSQFKPAVQGAAKFLGDQFNAVKPVIQNVTRESVRESTAAGLKIADAFAKPAITGSLQAFTAVGLPAAQGFATALAPVAARLALVAGAAILVADAIGAARKQMADMVAVADKASDLNVSAKFLQVFEGEARKLKVTTEELDGYLARAFSATKDKSPIDVSKWEAAGERITDIELALRVYNQELEKTSGKRLEGLVLFRDAETQDQKVRAVLEAMRQLEQVGQRTAALDIGEKMFGAQFVDRIRQGKLSVESMLDSMDKLAKSGDGIFQDEIVKRAKDIDDQLQLAEDRLSRALKPAWDGIASVLLSIKSTWADVVDLIARGVELVNSLSGSAAKSLVPQTAATTENGEGPRRVYITGAPTTSRGTGAAPTLRAKPTAESERDRFSGATDSVEKRIAGLRAEADAIDLTTEARGKAKIAAELETVAKQVNAAAGLGANVVTAEQRARIEELSSAYGKLVAQIEQLNSPLATFARESADIGKQLNQSAATELSNFGDAVADVVMKTKSFEDAFRSMANSVIRDLIRIGVQKSITGPIASALGGLFGMSGFGSVATDGIGGFGPTAPPGYASGTDFHPGGLAWVGENGPELLNLPRGSQVIPNEISRSIGGSSTIIGDINITVPEGTGPDNAAAIARAVRDTVVQVTDERLAYHSRARGMLGRF
jgi:hypothetical protein